MAAITDDVCALHGAAAEEGTGATQQLGGYLTSVGKSQQMEGGGPARMAQYLIDYNTAPPDTGPAGPAANPIPTKTSMALERGLVRLGKRIRESGAQNTHFYGIWRKPEHLGPGRLCIQPRPLRTLCTSKALTPAQWARIERECKPKQSGGVLALGKVPTLADVVRTCSSLLTEAAKAEQQEGTSG